MTSTQLTPCASDFYRVLNEVVTEIQSGHRVHILVPRSVSHWGDAFENQNWDKLEDIQMDYRGSILNPNVFVTLRFDKKDEKSPVMVDVCHFS